MILVKSSPCTPNRIRTIYIFCLWIKVRHSTLLRIILEVSFAQVSYTYLILLVLQGAKNYGERKLLIRQSPSLSCCMHKLYLALRYCLCSYIIGVADVGTSALWLFIELVTCNCRFHKLVTGIICLLKGPINRLFIMKFLAVGKT